MLLLFHTKNSNVACGSRDVTRAKSGHSQSTLRGTGKSEIVPYSSLDKNCSRL